jgi:hypothetical protein
VQEVIQDAVRVQQLTDVEVVGLDQSSPFYVSKVPEDVCRRVLEILDEEAQWEYTEISMTEVAAFISFWEKKAALGHGRRWGSLSHEEKNEHVPQDLAGFLVARKQWMPLLDAQDRKVYFSDPGAEGRAACLRQVEDLSDGWISFLGLLLEYVPGLFIKCEHLVRDLVRSCDGRVEVTMSPGPKEETQDFLTEMCQRLLDPYPYEDILYGKKMHWGCLLHHMVQAADERYGEAWPKHLVITCSSQLDTLDLVTLQQESELIACVVCDDTHWCLLLAHRHMRQAVLYDGLDNKQCWETAAAVVSHLEERTKREHVLVRGQCPRQRDAWSCGHRVLAVLKWILQDTPQLWPFAVPKEFFSEDTLKQLSFKPQWDADSARPQWDADSARPQSDRGEAQDSTSSQEGVTLDALVASASASGKRELDPAPAANSRKRAKSAPKPKPKKPLSQRQMQKQGADLAMLAGVTWNQKFQQAHEEHNSPYPAGHWPAFCIKLYQDVRISCKGCRHLKDLIEQAKVDALQARQLHLSAPETHQQVVPADEQEDPAPPPEEAQPAVVHRGRGRPKAGTQPATLQSWLDANRPGVYDYKHGTWWYCNYCERDCNFQRQTLSGKKHTESHEKSRDHQRGAQRASRTAALSIEPTARHTCPGIPIGEGLTTLDELQDAAKTWVLHGQLQLKDLDESEAAAQALFHWRGDRLVIKSALEHLLPSPAPTPSPPPTLFRGRTLSPFCSSEVQDALGRVPCPTRRARYAGSWQMPPPCGEKSFAGPLVSTSRSMPGHLRRRFKLRERMHGTA